MAKVNGTLQHLGLALVDGALVVAALGLALFLRFDLNAPPQFWLNRLGEVLPAVVLIHLLFFFLFGFYRRLWRYAGVEDLLLIAVAVSAAMGATFFYSRWVGLFLPRSTYVVGWFLLLIFVGGSRLAVRLLAAYLSRPAGVGKRRRALIVGAGEAGVLVAREMKKHGAALGVRVIGFIDDDPAKRRQVIQGLPVLGSRRELPGVVGRRQVAEVIIAMPSAPYSELQDIVGLCADLPVKIKTVPGIYKILEGQVSLNTLKEVDIEDLLRRLPVKQDIEAIAGYLAGETVLVTGAGGSIGAELCRQIAAVGPGRLILVDHDENGIFYMERELATDWPRLAVEPLVLDIKERQRVEEVFSAYRPAVVFHAAAHKHVPLMELNRDEAWHNNVEGSINLIDAAAAAGSKRFVFVSTDKAVKPRSVMGATKRVVEIYLQEKARHCQSCVFCAVRFGNVLGSQGSVVLLFREQIARGGPVTVTDPEMKRYFMTIPEAVQLVIQAGALGGGGEIFVLDMGEPVRILDLARDMIILSGLKPEEDIKIEFSGARPGEKLYEELFSDRENFALTRHERIFVAPDTSFDRAVLTAELEQLGRILGPGVTKVSGTIVTPGDGR